MFYVMTVVGEQPGTTSYHQVHHMVPVAAMTSDLTYCGCNYAIVVVNNDMSETISSDDSITRPIHVACDNGTTLIMVIANCHRFQTSNSFM